jgi:hypothetical protein
MAKTKDKIFGGKDGSAWKYFDADEFCEDFSENTIWCEDEFFKKNVLPSFEVNEVYVVNPNFKLFVVVKNKDYVKVFDSKGNEYNYMGFKATIENAENASDFYELVFNEPDLFYPKLYGYIKGRVPAEELMEYNFVFDVIEVTPKKNSIIQIPLTGYIDQYFNIDEDIKYWYKCSETNSCRFWSREDMWERLDEGSPITDFFSSSHSAYKKFDTILDSFKRVFGASANEMFYKILIQFFDDDIDYILETYKDFLNESLSQLVHESFMEDDKSFFKGKGNLDLNQNLLSIRADYLFYLLTLYRDDYLNFYSTMIKIVRNLKWDRYGYFAYDVLDLDEDTSFTQSISYMNQTNPYVDNIYKHFDTPEKISDFIELRKLMEKYPKGTYFTHPVDDTIVFRIGGFNLDSRKINISIGEQNEPLVYENFVDMKMSFQDLMEFLTNTKLKFESKNILLSLRKVLTDDSQ